MESIKSKVKQTIEELKESNIFGCISGSCMIDGDFDAWTDTPDVDVFVYCPEQLVHACTYLEGKGYKPANAGEEWKLDQIRHGRKGNKQKFIVQTHKLERDGIIVNVTHKPGCEKLTDVLASFDMSIIMIGWDIEKGYGLDYRVNWGQAFGDKGAKWSESTQVAVPNPMRDQEFTIYKVSMWVRQFDRVIKYWERGFDTRPMARFYLDAINDIIEKGALFQNDRATQAYNEFVEEFGPVRDRIRTWLEDKEDC